MPADNAQRQLTLAVRRVRARLGRVVRASPVAKPMSSLGLWIGSAGVDDADKNIAWNRRRWGNERAWRKLDSLGYQWGGGFAQTPALVAAMADRFLRPYLADRYDLAILELSPGGGRFTSELVRYAQRLSLVDLNAAAVEICRTRFGALPLPIDFIVNDGQSLQGVAGSPFDLIASYDSMVHMHPDVVRRYVAQMPDLLVEGGIAWLDHSGKGQRDRGSRTAVTAELMVTFATDAGLIVEDQVFRNDWDCISVLRKPWRGPAVGK